MRILRTLFEPRLIANTNINIKDRLFNFNARGLRTTPLNRNHAIERLRASFRDPSSPFYIAPGTQGPSSPGEGFINPEQVYRPAGIRELHSSSTESDESDEIMSSEEEGRMKLIEMGYEPSSFYVQKVVWGDLDSFRHVNNVRYLRYIESARLEWMLSLGRELGGSQKASDMAAGKGVSLILKDVGLKYIKPVLYPDTLIIAQKPHDPFPTHFSLSAVIWSTSQRAIVTKTWCTLVWYDYDRLKKCNPGEEAHAALAKRIR